MASLTEVLAALEHLQNQKPSLAPVMPQIRRMTELAAKATGASVTLRDDGDASVVLQFSGRNAGAAATLLRSQLADAKIGFAETLTFEIHRMLEGS